MPPESVSRTLRVSPRLAEIGLAYWVMASLDGCAMCVLDLLIQTESLMDEALAAAVERRNPARWPKRHVRRTMRALEGAGLIDHRRPSLQFIAPLGRAMRSDCDPLSLPSPRKNIAAWRDFLRGAGEFRAATGALLSRSRLETGVLLQTIAEAYEDDMGEQPPESHAEGFLERLYAAGLVDIEDGVCSRTRLCERIWADMTISSWA